MENLAHLVFEACFLKRVPRSGFQFLGAGQESVAEHTYGATFIAFVLSQLEPRADAQRLMTMCLVHDLPEARMGDLNYVQKHYVQADEHKATTDALNDLPFGDYLTGLLTEFKQGDSLEAQLAHDADQLALLVDLKSLNDLGYQTPQQWLPHVEKRLKTAPGKDLAKAVLSTTKDAWWLKIFVDSNDVLQ